MAENKDGKEENTPTTLPEPRPNYDDSRLVIKEGNNGKK